jgi:hypothetical protein
MPFIRNKLSNPTSDMHAQLNFPAGDGTLLQNDVVPCMQADKLGEITFPMSDSFPLVVPRKSFFPGATPASFLLHLWASQGVL